MLKNTETVQFPVTFTRKGYIQLHLKRRILSTLSFIYSRLAPLSSSNCPSSPFPVTCLSQSQRFCSHRKQTKMHTTQKQNKQKTSPQEKAARTLDEIFSHESKKDNRHLLICLLSSLKALKLIHGFISTIK